MFRRDEKPEKRMHQEVREPDDTYAGCKSAGMPVPGIGRKKRFDREILPNHQCRVSKAEAVRQKKPGEFHDRVIGGTQGSVITWDQNWKDLNRRKTFSNKNGRYVGADGKEIPRNLTREEARRYNKGRQRLKGPKDSYYREPTDRSTNIETDSQVWSLMTTNDLDSEVASQANYEDFQKSRNSGARYSNKSYSSHNPILKPRSWDTPTHTGERGGMGGRKAVVPMPDRATARLKKDPNYWRGNGDGTHPDEKKHFTTEPHEKFIPVSSDRGKRKLEHPKLKSEDYDILNPQFVSRKFVDKERKRQEKKMMTQGFGRTNVTSDEMNDCFYESSFEPPSRVDKLRATEGNMTPSPRKIRHDRPPGGTRYHESAEVASKVRDLKRAEIREHQRVARDNRDQRQLYDYNRRKTVNGDGLRLG